MQQVVVCIEEMQVQMSDLNRQVIIVKNYSKRLQQNVLELIKTPPKEQNVKK